MINQQSGEPALEGLENLALRQIHHDGEVVEVHELLLGVAPRVGDALAGLRRRMKNE